MQWCALERGLLSNRKNWDETLHYVGVGIRNSRLIRVVVCNLHVVLSKPFATGVLMTLIDIYGRRYIVEVFKEAIVLFKEWQIRSYLRSSRRYFFLLRNPWEFEEWRSKMPIAQQEMSQPRGDWPRNIQWKILMKKAAKNWLITASLIWIDLLTSHEKWAERIPLSFCNDLSDIFASPRSRENWMPERPKLMTTGQYFWPGHKWQIASAFVSSVSSASLICISFEELSLNSTSSVFQAQKRALF